MLGFWKKYRKKLLLSFLPAIAYVIVSTMKLILWTCRVQIEGLEQFHALAKQNSCILMFWHNRSSILSYIFSKYTPDLLFAVLASTSATGNLSTTILYTFHNITTIRCPSSKGYLALKTCIDQINQNNQIIVITADGSRGPKYDFKPGIPFIALKTGAHVVPVDWQANRQWELNTWDQMRIPKPFSKICITIHPSICFDKHPLPSLEEAKEILKGSLRM